MGPTECKYCGCDKFNADSVSMTRFRCGSSYWHNEEMWQIANGCAAKCAVQLVELKERVQRAVEALEGSYRIIIKLNGDNEDVVFATDVDRAIEILEGEEDDDINSSKSSNSSPITTDDLAAADYFEAVRQRVPYYNTDQSYTATVQLV